MYFNAVKDILDLAIPRFIAENGLKEADVDQCIGAHIVKTSNEHRNPDPNIDYNDPLCRLAYLYVHTAANATLFERTLNETDALQKLLKARDGGRIDICAVGGGPGTELLGLAKFLVHRHYRPLTWEFTVLDAVPEWGETWTMLADRCRQGVGTALADTAPSINKGFFPMDVTDPNSYGTYGWLFGGADIVVLNYILSENQVRMTAATKALANLANKAKPGAFFVVIDRLEYGSTFFADSKAAVANCGLNVVSERSFAGSLSSDEQADDLEPFKSRFGRMPRVKFFTDRERRPTAFAIVAQKPA